MASEETKTPSIIGAPVPRVDGPLKVSGNAMYTSDFHFPGMVYAVPVCSTVAKGRITRLDTSEAEKMVGVVAILHRQNIGKLYRSAPDQTFSAYLDEKRPPFEDDIISYGGQYVALAVAETFEQAQAAAAAVTVANLRFFFAVAYGHCSRGSLRLFEGSGNGERHILAPVRDDIILQRRTFFVEIGAKCLVGRRPVQFADILAMQNGHHSHHLFRLGGIESGNSPLRHRTADRNCIDHSRKVEIQSVHGVSTDFERPIDPGHRCSNYRRGYGLF